VAMSDAAAADTAAFDMSPTRPELEEQLKKSMDEVRNGWSQLPLLAIQFIDLVAVIGWLNFRCSHMSRCPETLGEHLQMSRWPTARSCRDARKGSASISRCPDGRMLASVEMPGDARRASPDVQMPAGLQLSRWCEILGERMGLCGGAVATAYRTPHQVTSLEMQLVAANAKVAYFRRRLRKCIAEELVSQCPAMRLSSELAVLQSCRLNKRPAHMKIQ